MLDVTTRFQNVRPFQTGSDIVPDVTTSVQNDLLKPEVIYFCEIIENLNFRF